MGCSGSPRLRIWGTFDPFLPLFPHSRGGSFRAAPPVTSRANGRSHFCPLILLEPLSFLADSTFSTLSAPYDRPYLIPPPLIILQSWLFLGKVHFWDEEEESIHNSPVDQYTHKLSITTSRNLGLLNQKEMQSEKDSCMSCSTHKTRSYARTSPKDQANTKKGGGEKTPWRTTPTAPPSSCVSRRYGKPFSPLSGLTTATTAIPFTGLIDASCKFTA